MRAAGRSALAIVGLAGALASGRAAVLAGDAPEKSVPAVRVILPIADQPRSLGLGLAEIPQVEEVRVYIPQRGVVCSTIRSVPRDETSDPGYGELSARLVADAGREADAMRKFGKAKDFTVTESFASKAVALAELEKLRTEIVRDVTKRARELKLLD